MLNVKVDLDGSPCASRYERSSTKIRDPRLPTARVDADYLLAPARLANSSARVIGRTRHTVTATVTVTCFVSNLESVYGR
jgi:hypothetical protein